MRYEINCIFTVQLYLLTIISFIYYYFIYIIEKIQETKTRGWLLKTPRNSKSTAINIKRQLKLTNT